MTKHHYVVLEWHADIKAENRSYKSWSRESASGFICEGVFIL